MLGAQGGPAHLTPRPAVCSPPLPRDHSLVGTLHSRVSDHHLKFPFCKVQGGKTEELNRDRHPKASVKVGVATYKKGCIGFDSS